MEFSDKIRVFVSESLQEQRLQRLSGGKRQLRQFEPYLGEKAIVACDGLAFSKDLYEMLQTLFPEKQITCINSENSGEPWAKALIENINQEVTALDCLIYSPSVNSGVSIDIEHFHQVFGVFVGGSITGTDCLQALNRYRPKVDWHVWVEDKPIGGYRPTHAERIQQNKLKANDLCGFLLGIVPGTGERVVQDQFAWDAWAHLTARRHESLNNLRGDVHYLLEQQNHHLIPVGDSFDSGTKAELIQARAVNRQVWKQGILTAERITATEARRLEAKERPTLQDLYQLERHRIEKSWGQAITEELIDLDDGGRTIHQFSILESLLEPPAEVKQVQGKRIFFPPDLVAQRDLYEREKYHTLDWRNYSVAWSLRVELGLPQLLDPERVFRSDDPDLIEMAQKAQRNDLLIKEFLGVTIRKSATPIQILQPLLEQCGLKLTYLGRKGGKKQQVRMYQIGVQQWQTAMAVLQYRRYQRKSQNSSTVEVQNALVVTGGILDKEINKGGAVTTEVVSEVLPLPELEDALDLVRQAVEIGDPEALRAVWNLWDERQQQQLWEAVSDQYRYEVTQMLKMSEISAKASSFPALMRELASGSS